MTKKAYNVDWVVYGTVRGIEAESADAAHREIMAMGMDELIERSVDPTLEADAPGESGGEKAAVGSPTP